MRLKSFFQSSLSSFVLAALAFSHLAEAASDKAIQANCHLHPTKGNRVEGTVTFTAVAGGVKITADVEHLSPGKHGFHIHEYGDCSSPDGSSAGGHFNPSGAKHGSPEGLERHVGDLGNLVADSKGHAHYERIDSVIKLEGPHAIIGRSMVVHALPDDYSTQPTGNAGGRQACGIIDR